MGMTWGFDLTANNLNKTSALCHINHPYSVPIRVPLPFPLKMFSKLCIWQIATFFSGLFCKLPWIICLGFCRHPFSPACGVIVVLFGAKAFQSIPVDQHYFYHWQSKTKVETQVVKRETKAAGVSLHSRQLM